MMNDELKRGGKVKKALLVIDYTQDFVARDGALSCGEPGISLEEYITDLTEKFLDASHLVVMPLMYTK